MSFNRLTEYWEQQTKLPREVDRDLARPEDLNVDIMPLRNLTDIGRVTLKIRGESHKRRTSVAHREGYTWSPIACEDCSR